MLFFQFLPFLFKVFDEMDFYGRQAISCSFLELVNSVSAFNLATSAEMTPA